MILFTDKETWDKAHVSMVGMKQGKDYHILKKGLWEDENGLLHTTIGVFKIVERGANHVVRGIRVRFV